MLIRKISAGTFVFAAAIFLASTSGVVAQQLPLFAQIPGLPGSAEPTASTSSAHGAPVVVNGRSLFTVFAASQAEAQDRAELIDLRLEKAIPVVAATQTPPDIAARSVDREVCILLNGKILLAVTDLDATASGETVPAVAAEWSDQIAKTLYRARRERSPGFVRDQAKRAGVVVIVALLVNLLIWMLTRRLKEHPSWVSQVFVWLIALYVITQMFPQTQVVHEIIESGVLRPYSICVVVALAASILAWFLRLVLHIVFPPVTDTLSPEERTERTLQRRSTLGTVARITGVTVIWIVAVVVALSWIGVNLSAFLTSAGLLGVIIGLAAQDTMKDLVSGVNILIDDRFGVGDFIEVGAYSGTVEKLNLRVTQIRDSQGRLITFPNRSIELVANHTARWAQVDFRVGIAYNSDLRSTMALMVDVANKLKDDYPHQILAPPQMLGVESYNDSDITVRMAIRTAPGDQWAIGRELRLRLKEAFDAAGIEIPFPQSVVHHNMLPQETGDGDETEQALSSIGVGTSKPAPTEPPV
ncbi:MAG: mechanosensitive ion channel family protein [Capsulimonadaceae bacterium]|nr:mechanosensitive ion channel family protein [Capsulimonadaceae bacterium]